MKLMIVESPNKVKKLSSLLGSEWSVAASVGHIRDLPRKKLGVDLEDFSLQYEFIPETTFKTRTFSGGEERVAKIKSLAKKADMIYLAADPDREGEAIAWHIKECLGIGEDDYTRITFDSITDKAINEALTKGRKIDYSLVRAQEARRALDRCYGYMVSPIVSNSLGMSLSAGRVQSPAVRLVVERANEINGFKKTSHFGAKVTFDNTWSAEWDTTPYLKTEAKYITDEDLALKASECREFNILSCDNKTAKKAPPSPFSTSLLLQAASVKLKLDPEVTAGLAQKLFEQGVITYIRTDSVNLSEEAIEEIRAYAVEKNLPLPEKARKFKTKGSAEEAHEAIRPTHIEAEGCGENEQQKALYKLIWDRSVASQLADAEYSVNTIKLESKEAKFIFSAVGRVLTAKGWRALTSADAVAEDDDKATDSEAVPILTVGDVITASKGEVLNKVTSPPARFTKASLIAKLEHEGIGRPSTYAAIMKNIMDKGYLSEDKRFLAPTEIGTLLVAELIKAGFAFMDFSFTRELELKLDEIASSNDDYLNVVSSAVTQLNDELKAVSKTTSLKPRFPCPKCKESGMRRFKRKTGSGYLWACSSDSCDNFMDDKDGKPLEVERHTCPTCKVADLRRYKKKPNASGKAQGFGWFCSDKECETFLDDNKGKPLAIKTSPCPNCSRPMIRRMGDSGYWWGCSGFKDGCKTTMDDQNGKPVEKKVKKA